MIRTGIGQDSHRFLEKFDAKKPVVLGGVIVDRTKSIDANSDGDVILHALFNAISSAIGGKSLGYYADDLFKKGIADSSKYLGIIIKEMHKLGYEINNISISIEAKYPKIDMNSDKIIKNLSTILKIDKSCIGLTATSGEGLTGSGRGEGIACMCVVSLRKV